MRWTVVSLAVLLTCAATNHAAAQKRVALVIGNEKYTVQPALTNPSRDARLVGETLQKLGFRLVGDRPLVDLDKAATDKMIANFGAMARDADIALFYYSGHGMQLDGRNFLFPVDLGSIAPGTPATVVGLQTLNADTVLALMSELRARLKILLLDACRTPFAKGPSGGFVPMIAPAEVGLATGTVIGFATQPNTIAWPGHPGETSPYAKALASFMTVRGLELFRLLNEAGLQVMSTTRKAQQPWITASPIEGRVYLNPPIAVAAIPATPPELKGRDTPESTATPSSPINNGKSSSFIQKAYGEMEAGDYAKARATLTQGIELDPNSASAFSYRGFAWYLEGLTKNPDSALTTYRQSFADLDRSIRLDPSYAPVRRHRGQTIVATYRALKALGKPTNDIIDRAIDDFKDAIKLDPTSKTNANALGQAYLIKGAYQTAIESFNKAIEHDRSYAAPYAGLCMAYRMKGNLDEARKNAQLAADRDSDLKSKSCLTKPI